MPKAAHGTAGKKPAVDINKWNKMAQQQAEEYKKGEARDGRFFPDNGDYLFIFKGVHRDIFPADEDRPARPYFCPLWKIAENETNPEDYRGKEFRGEIFDFSVKKGGFCPTKNFLAETIGKAAITDDPIQDCNNLDALAGCFMEVKCETKEASYNDKKTGQKKSITNHRVYVKRILDVNPDETEEAPAETAPEEHDEAIPDDQFTDGETTESSAETAPAGQVMIPDVGDKVQLREVGSGTVTGTIDAVNGDKYEDGWCSCTFPKPKGKGTVSIKKKYTELQWHDVAGVFMDA